MFEITVLKKGHLKEGFEASKIYDSLLKETDINQKNAQFITRKVYAFIITAKLHIITAPMIREITCVKLLEFGFEIERLQYTRIGNPKADIQRIVEQNPVRCVQMLGDHDIEENEAVNELIEQLKGGGQ